MSPINSITILHGIQTLPIFNIPPLVTELKEESMADSANSGSTESPDKKPRCIHTILPSCSFCFRLGSYPCNIESLVWWYELRERGLSPGPHSRS